MSEFTSGAHAAIDAVIGMFSEINETPIYGAVKYGAKVFERNGDRFISLDNIIELLEHHRDVSTKKLNKQQQEIEHNA